MIYKCRIIIVSVSESIGYPYRFIISYENIFNEIYIVEIIYKQFLLWSNNKLQCVTRKSKISSQLFSACFLLSQRRGSYISYQTDTESKTPVLSCIEFIAYWVPITTVLPRSLLRIETSGVFFLARQWTLVFHKIAGDFFSGWATLGFSKRTQFRGVR
jgi:hypothetical protein